MAMLTAETKFGVVRGVPGHNGKSTVFKGIPYAKPPVGELRFAPPVPCDPWEGELLCDHFQASPLQEGAPRREIPVISEDCLYLNIWTPAETGEEKLPVLFWVYGGGFVTGSGTEPEFGGEALNEKGAIVVTFNYRLSVMGFLALPQLLERDGVTGNSGLRDQMSALKWVHENIAAFGGDPDNITVFGFSAGGMSTRMLAVSPMSRDMIKRIIVQSGGGVTDSDYYRPLKEKMEICERGMARLGWDMEDLRTRDGMEIMKRLQEATITELEGWEKSVFQPDVDGITLMDTPGVSLWKGDYNDIPILAGSVTGDNGWIKIVRNEVEDETMIPAFVYSRSVAWAQRNAEAGRTPIYSYHFERTQPQIRWGGPGNRTPHGSDITYTMGTLNEIDCASEFTEYDREISALMVSYWANFARTGDPNGEGVMEWPPYTLDHRCSLHITDEEICVEKLMKTPAHERAIRFVTDHPGVIRSLEGI